MKIHKHNSLKSIPFIALAFSFFAFHASCLQAQDKAKSADSDKKPIFIKNKPAGKATPAGEGINYEREIGIQVEYFKLDHTRANEFVNKFSSKAYDAQELRDGLETLINQNQAQLIETTWIRAMDGLRVKNRLAIQYGPRG